MTTNIVRRIGIVIQEKMSRKVSRLFAPWSAARTAAEEREFRGVTGHLATVTSAAENDFIVENFAELFSDTFAIWAWIGLTDMEREGVFKWVTDEPFVYSNWGGNEPNNAASGPGEDRVEYAFLDWNDYRNTNANGPFPIGYIVEYPLTGRSFDRGDVNADGTTDISDPIAILEVLFLGNGEFVCESAADIGDDGEINITDAIGLLGFLFLGTLAPPAPSGVCGKDLDKEALPCESFPPCE